mmetsp:Transcript_37944/g.95289  ORF Transcript_37944/g.95289 Transcript_37944/m.95289 type:complete len:273 (-) Transcript_37944:3946-4764(-)
MVGDATRAELELEVVALTPLLPSLPLAILPARDARHVTEATLCLLQRRLARLPAQFWVDLDVPLAGLVASLARCRARGPLGPLCHQAILRAAGSTWMRLATPRLLLAICWIASLNVLCASHTSQASTHSGRLDVPAPRPIPVAIIRTWSPRRPLRELAIVIARATLGLATCKLGIRPGRRIAAPRVPDRQAPAPLARAPPAGGAAAAPVLPLVPLAIHATLRLPSAIWHRHHLLLVPRHAQAAPARGQPLDRAAPALVAHAADVGRRDAVAP